MKNQLILARTASGLAAVFANQVLIAATSQTGGFAKVNVEKVARNLSAALATPVIECEVKAPAVGETWADIYARLPPVEALMEQEDYVLYVWSEGGREEDTQYGPGDAYEELNIDSEPPKGVPYTVMVPLHYVAGTNRTSTTEPVGHWAHYDDNGRPDTHEFLIDDQRRLAGHATMELTVLGPAPDLAPLTAISPESLSVSMEVTTDPLDGPAAVPCALVRDDKGEVQLSIIRTGGRLLVRPETRVSLTGTLIGPQGKRETAYWVG